ncbi:hypothetical protein ABK040_012461 [Willaertia magna]
MLSSSSAVTNTPQQVEQLIKRPYETIKQIIKQQQSSPNQLPYTIQNHFKQNLDNFISQIPNLTIHSTPNTIVKYRCCVQDMNNNELCTIHSLFMDHNPLETLQKDNDEQMFQQPQDQDTYFERNKFYCIPIPGETKWAKELIQNVIVDNTISLNDNLVNDDDKVKRKRGDEEEDEEMDDDEEEEDFDIVVIKEETNKTSSQLSISEKKEITKKIKNQQKSENNNNRRDPTREEMLDFPLKGETGTSCFVKIYDEEVNLKNTEIVDLIGIVNFELGVGSSTGMLDEDDFFSPFTPEGSLVPRLHLLFYKSYRTVFDYIPFNIFNSTQTIIPQIRNHLINYLSINCCKNDLLVAEYLLLHLLSRVRSYQFDVTLGKFILNIMNCQEIDFARQVNNVLETILPAVHVLDLSNENLDNLSFVPVKDYDLDKLKAGVFQLCSGTHLIVNENALTEGNLSEKAVRNLTSLAQLIALQKIDYDYKYHNFTMQVNIPVLICSKGRTLFHDRDVNCIVQLTPQEQPSTSNTSLTFTKEDLVMFREYIAYTVTHNDNDIKINEEVKQAIQQTFVNARLKDNSITEKTLHDWLTTTELLHLSLGNIDKEVDMNTWNHVVNLETERNKR